MKIFTLLPRYLSRSFLGSLCGITTCLFFIIFLCEFAEIQRRLNDKDVSFILKINASLLRAPSSIEQILPFLVFTAALYVFWQMHRSNELLIFRSVGISLWRIILPISLTALMIGFLSLTLFNPFSSALQRAYEKFDRTHFSTTKPKENLKISSTGIWLSEKRGLNQAIYRADKIDLKTLTLFNPNIIIMSPNNIFVERIDATTAQIKDGSLVLKEGWQTPAGKSATSFTEKTIETSLNKATIENMKVHRETISFWAIPPYIALLEASGLRVVKYQVYWHSQLAFAFWLGAMVLLAAAFSCQPHRQGKTTLIILAGLLVEFALYFFKDITFALGTSGTLPPIIAAWLPPLLTLMVGAVLVFNQEDG